MTLATTHSASEVPAKKSPHPDYSDRVRIEQYDLEVGPLQHLAVERQRLRNLTWQHFDVVPLGSTIGGELRGIDITHASAAGRGGRRDPARAQRVYKVIFFRDQPMDAASQVAFLAPLQRARGAPVLAGQHVGADRREVREVGKDRRLRERLAPR